jgi:hypothetical protein
MSRVHVVVRVWDGCPQTVSLHSTLEGAAKSVYQQMKEEIEESDGSLDNFNQWLKEERNWDMPWQPMYTLVDLCMAATDVSDYLDTPIHVGVAVVDAGSETLY